ncbi:MAG TPA: small ribosomal subunit Rsm22 family protein [Rhizomicrobium sp.]|nr:small ribosomal subunit Rsm22 family protein [Rhizomicrobium sp.]
MTVTGRMDALAYLVTRFPATYAAAHAALRRTEEASPQFSPSSLLDVGAGPGTVALAARAVWPSLDAVTLLEPNAIFRRVAEELWRNAKIVAGALGGVLPNADLVTAGYVLAELDLATIPQAARALWGAANQVLVLIEPGTPDGFARILAARRVLIEEGAHVVAPCTHDNECPMTGGDWCHFSQRLARSRDHMMVKSASVPFEDERYAYLVVSRARVAHTQARIIKPPVEQKRAIAFPLCDSKGLHIEAVPRRDKEQYRAARKKKWGDLF